MMDFKELITSTGVLYRRVAVHWGLRRDGTWTPLASPRGRSKGGDFVKIVVSEIQPAPVHASLRRFDSRLTSIEEGVAVVEEQVQITKDRLEQLEAAEKANAKREKILLGAAQRLQRARKDADRLVPALRELTTSDESVARETGTVNADLQKALAEVEDAMTVLSRQEEIKQLRGELALLTTQRSEMERQLVESKAAQQREMEAALAEHATAQKELRQQVERGQRELTALRDSSRTVSAEKDRLATDLQELKASKTKGDAAYAEAQRKLKAQLDEKSRLSKQQIETLSAKLREQEERVLQIEGQKKHEEMQWSLQRQRAETLVGTLKKQEAQLLEQVSSLSVGATRNGAELTSAKARVEELQRQFEQANTEASQLRERLAQQEKSAAALRRDLEDLGASKRTLEQALASEKQRAETEEARLKQLIGKNEAANSELARKLQVAEQSLREVSAEFEQQKAQIVEAAVAKRKWDEEMHGLQEELRQAREHLEKGKVALEAKTADFEDSKRAESKVGDELRKEKEAVRDLEGRITVLHAQMKRESAASEQRFREQEKSFQERLAAAEKLYSQEHQQKLEAIKKEHQQQLERSQGELERALRDLELLKRENALKDDRVKALDADLERLRVEAGSLRSDLGTRSSELSAAQSGLRTAASKYEDRVRELVLINQWKVFAGQLLLNATFRARREFVMAAVMTRKNIEERQEREEERKRGAEGRWAVLAQGLVSAGNSREEARRRHAVMEGLRKMRAEIQRLHNSRQDLERQLADSKAAHQKLLEEIASSPVAQRVGEAERVRFAELARDGGANNSPLVRRLFAVKLRRRLGADGTAQVLFDGSPSTLSRSSSTRGNGTTDHYGAPDGGDTDFETLAAIEEQRRREQEQRRQSGANGRRSSTATGSHSRELRHHVADDDHSGNGRSLDPSSSKHGSSSSRGTDDEKRRAVAENAGQRAKHAGKKGPGDQACHCIVQ